MRCLPGLVLLMLTATSLTATAQTTPQTTAPKRTVYLTGMALEELKTSNPAHYTRALKVMDEMSKPCPEGEWQSRPIQQRPSPSQCSAFLLQTSNPPKRQITFILDDTVYIANVVLKSDVGAWHLDPTPPKQ
jgi:hypothetical protein